VPDHKGLQELLELHGAPLLATTLIPPGETEPLNDAQDDPRPLRKAARCHRDRRRRLPLEPTTVIDLTPMGNGGDPEVLREGAAACRAGAPHTTSSQITLQRLSRKRWQLLSETISRGQSPSGKLIQTVLIYALPVLFAITVHEAAHGYAARHFGDNTAYMMGRITLNPLKHIDPVGTILMPLLLYFATSGAFLFGYAKPVPVNFGNLRNPKRDMVWVALAGPGSNFMQAVLWGWCCWYLLVGTSAWTSASSLKWRRPACWSTW
jgi:hypothetical protein